MTAKRPRRVNYPRRPLSATQSDETAGRVLSCHRAPGDPAAAGVTEWEPVPL
jgi:hypothetical protein